MRKKIIIGIGLMLISILMFGCSSKGLSTDSQLKDQYKKDVSTTFAENYNKLTLCSVKLSENYDKIKNGNLDEYVGLSDSVRKLEEGESRTDTESMLLKKQDNIYSDLLSNYVDKKDTKAKLKEDVQSVLDYYK